LQRRQLWPATHHQAGNFFLGPQCAADLAKTDCGIM
jgi:hypothetical protein